MATTKTDPKLALANGTPAHEQRSQSSKTDSPVSN